MSINLFKIQNVYNISIKTKGKLFDSYKYNNNYFD